MKCPNCGATLLDDSKFCTKCGTKIIHPQNKICAQCGTENQPDAKFCVKCGNKLSDAFFVIEADENAEVLIVDEAPKTKRKRTTKPKEEPLVVNLDTDDYEIKVVEQPKTTRTRKTKKAEEPAPLVVSLDTDDYEIKVVEAKSKSVAPKLKKSTIKASSSPGEMRLDLDFDEA